jgi:hypothetical protein
MAQADSAACGLPFPSTKATFAGPRLLVETGPSFIQLSRHATDRTWDISAVYTHRCEWQVPLKSDIASVLPWSVVAQYARSQARP